MESAKAMTHLDVVQEYVNDLPDSRLMMTTTHVLVSAVDRSGVDHFGWVSRLLRIIEHVVAVESFPDVGPGGSAVTSFWPQPSVQSQYRR